MRKRPAAIVRDKLKSFADRGVFEDFSESKKRSGTVTFEFLVFDDNRVTVELSERDHTLVVRNMLRDVPAAMYTDLEAFLAALFDRDLPPHRRLDRRSAEARFVRRKGQVSLVVTVRSNRYTYAVEKLISLISWVRTHLQQWHPSYLWEVVGESEG